MGLAATCCSKETNIGPLQWGHQMQVRVSELRFPFCHATCAAKWCGVGWLVRGISGSKASPDQDGLLIPLVDANLANVNLHLPQYQWLVHASTTMFFPEKLEPVIDICRYLGVNCWRATNGKKNTYLGCCLPCNYLDAVWMFCGCHVRTQCRNRTSTANSDYQGLSEIIRDYQHYMVVPKWTKMDLNNLPLWLGLKPFWLTKWMWVIFGEGKPHSKNTATHIRFFVFVCLS